MSTLKDKTNSLRRNLMRGLTKNIGQTQLENVDLADLSINNVLISRPNSRLGNLLMVTPLLQEVISYFPHCKIDLLVMGTAAPQIFKNYKNVDRIISLPKKPFSNLFKYLQSWLALRNHRYDLVINVAESSSSGRLSTKFAKAKFKIFGDINNGLAIQNRDYNHMAKHPVYNFRTYMEQLGWLRNLEPIRTLSIKLTESEIEQGRENLERLVENHKKTISIFTNATGRKCYSEEWWEEFYNTLKSRHPDCNIIEVLPMENVSKIGFKAPFFYSRDIREIGGLIANTDVFIGADSGMMHLASAVHTPTIGLFSVTDPLKYEPYNEFSAAFNTNTNNLETCFDWIDELLHGDKNHRRKSI